MMAARASWKGILKLGEVSCPVALYTAASTAERISFHILNRKTGHRVHRQFVDAETEKPVEAKDQVKGYIRITDHSKTAQHAGGLTVEEIEEQHADIDRLNQTFGDRFHIFKGIESDILPDGSLD